MQLFIRKLVLWPRDARFDRREITFETGKIIDQPSQVYFPSGIPSDAEDESDDVVSTRKIFEALEMGLRNSECRLQIIVTEHADERTIRGISTLHKVEDWHGAGKDWLIPHEWIES